MAMAMAMPGLLFLLLGLNLSVAEVAEGAILVLMIRQLPAEMAVTVEPVMEVRELPARPMQQMVLMEPAAVAEEVLERDGLSAPARINPAVMAVKVAMDMWRFTVGSDFNENSLFK